MTLHDRQAQSDDERRTDQRRPRARRHAAAGRSAGDARRLNLNLRQSGIYIAFALIVVLFTVLTGGDLLQPQNISNIIVQNSYILILAIGMILVIIAGHIDLSVGSVVAACGAIAAVLMVDHDVPWPLALLITLVVGGADRRLAGLLGRVLRHPGVHRHAGRHAAVPGADPDRPRQPGHRPVPGRGPHPVQRLHRGLPGQHRARPARRRRPVQPAGRRWSRWPASWSPSGAPGPPGCATSRRSTRCRCSSLKIVLAAVVRDVRGRAAGPVPEPALGAGAARRPGDRLLGADQPGGVRPADLRRRRQPAGRDAVRRQGQVGGLLDLREHGRAGRAGRRRSSPAGSTRPTRPPATSSSWTRSPRRSSAARRCRAASARWSAPSPAA